VTVDQSQQPAYLQPYARAVKRHGTGDHRALLWASRRTQEQRFDALLRLANPAGLSVLDLGCGCGDLLDFLIARHATPARYVGIEGVGDLAEAAKGKRHPNASIVRGDFVAEPWRMLVDADVVYCSGALNTIDAGDFYAVIRSAFAAARRTLVFNFLCSPLLAGMSYLRWYDRRDVVRFARSLTSGVEVLEDYIDGDCTIALRKAQAAS
jgi:SAM-dependent methyltransferase